MPAPLIVDITALQSPTFAHQISLELTINIVSAAPHCQIGFSSYAAIIGLEWVLQNLYWNISGYPKYSLISFNPGFD